MHQPAPSTSLQSGLRPTIAGLLVVFALIAGSTGARSSGSSASSPGGGNGLAVPVITAPPARPSPSSAAIPGNPGRGEVRGGEATAEVGVLRDGVTVFDELPGIVHLDDDLLAALRRAAKAAGGEGVALEVNSGWRSAALQAQLLDAAIATYGSEAEAARWVATPTTSPHVSGDAVDLAAAGAAWLSAHGATYGLCQIYRNEPWHFELRPEAIAGRCPRMYADPPHDPRMR
jgi:hypothetical protein